MTPTPPSGSHLPLKVFTRHSRHWRENRYVYPVISRRSEGMSIGINLNPDKICNFGCVYCQVDRDEQGRRPEKVEVPVIREELISLLQQVETGVIWQDGAFCDLPRKLKRLNDIALSGDAEPTSSPNLLEVVQCIAQVKSEMGFNDTKLILITNATLLNRKPVQEALKVMAQHQGEIWAKLDAGDQAYFEQIDQTTIRLDHVLSNILQAGRTRPIVIQTMLARLAGNPMSASQQQAYVHALDQLLGKGCQIAKVQLYTVARPPAESHVQPVDHTWMTQLKAQIHALCPDLAVQVY